MPILSASYSNTRALDFTNWSASVAIEQFNQAYYGTLLSASITVYPTFRTFARIENLSTASASVTLVTVATGSYLVVESTSSTELINARAHVTFSNTLATYDGLADYGGSSGVSNARRTGTSVTTSSVIFPFDNFTGSGYVALQITASAVANLYEGSATGSPYSENFLLSVRPEMAATITVEYVYLQTTSSLSGYAWDDVNSDGVFDGGEVGLAGVTFSMLDEFGAPVAGQDPVVTDVNGYYEFINLFPGNYYISYDTLPGYVATYDPDGVGENYFYINIPANTDVTQSNVGFGPAPTTGFVIGFTFNDANADGIVDFGETGVSAVPIELWNETEDTLIDSTVSDITGSFRFTDIAPGTYYVKYTPPSGSIVTVDGDALGDDKVAIIASEGSYQELYIGFYTAEVTGSPSASLSASIPINLNTVNTINGAAYVYDFNNLVNDHVVGNVFYRNGKIIFSNSGSVFDELLKDRSDLTSAKYNITYKSQQTFYEKQVLCRIEPGEFNYSTNPSALVANEFEFDIDKNNYFTYVDLDLILRYISLKVNNDYEWYNYLSDIFTDVDEDWYAYYSVKYNLTNKDASYHIPYIDYLESIYTSFDIDGNNKIQITDAYLMFKYFTNTLTKDVIFKYADIRSSRKNVESIIRYMDEKIGKYGYGRINPEFFGYEYSSSLDKTGSYLAPFITTIGLYSGTELVGVAKLGMPIKNSGELPLNILVKWDI